MDPTDQLKNLVLMSAADGSFNQDEIRFLSQRAAAWGIPDQEFVQAFDEALSRQYSLVVPADREAQIEMLENMVRMMDSDGQIANVERKLLATAAIATGTSPSELDAIMKRVLGSSPPTP
jgi:uncharacterized tellurite resistance protein B-like protein